MRRLIITLAALAIVVIAPDALDAKPKPIDASSMVETMQVFHDGSGHYLAYWPEPKQKRGRLFWGNGRRFVEMPTGTGYSRKTALRFTVYDRRLVKAHVEFDRDRATAFCMRSQAQNDQVTKPLSKLSDGETRKMLARAKFFPKVVIREPHLLSRDALGIYYYVDRAPGRPWTDYRLFIGEAGKMQRMPIRTVALDSVGQVFATKKGALQVKRIPKTGLEAFAWVLPNRRDRYDLTSVPTRLNEDVIFNVLGVYGVRRLGSHCDDM